jgi:hypothetical protein
MASLSAYYPLPVVAGTTAGTYAEGDDSRITGALPAATAGTGSVLASGSTTSRTLANRFAERVNVKDFGAVGNGTTNDQPAIQSAINAAPAGAIIYFPEGTYFLGVSSVSGFSCTAGTNDVITAVGHNFINDQIVIFTSLTGGTGLTINRPYVVRDVSGDTFKVAFSRGGGAVDITSAMTAGSVSGAGLIANKSLSFLGEKNSSTILLDKLIPIGVNITGGSIFDFYNLNFVYNQGWFDSGTYASGGRFQSAIESINIIDQNGEIKLVNCRFENIPNCLFSSGYNNLLIDGCEFIYQYGFAGCRWYTPVGNDIGHPALPIVGAANITKVTNCYFDGLVDRTFTGVQGNPPDKYKSPLDGFYFTAGTSPLYQEVSNCMMLNHGIEGIYVYGMAPDRSYFENPALNKSVTSLTAADSGNATWTKIVTATVPNHGYKIGETVLISGANGSAANEYNSYHVIHSVVDQDSFTYYTKSVPSSPATGTITANVNTIKEKRKTIVKNNYCSASSLKSAYYAGTQPSIVANTTIGECEISGNTVNGSPQAISFPRTAFGFPDSVLKYRPVIKNNYFENVLTGIFIESGSQEGTLIEGNTIRTSSQFGKNQINDPRYSFPYCFHMPISFFEGKAIIRNNTIIQEDPLWDAVLTVTSRNSGTSSFTVTDGTLVSDNLAPLDFNNVQDYGALIAYTTNKLEAFPITGINGNDLVVNADFFNNQTAFSTGTIYWAKSKGDQWPRNAAIWIAGGATSELSIENNKIVNPQNDILVNAGTGPVRCFGNIVSDAKAYLTSGITRIGYEVRDNEILYFNQTGTVAPSSTPKFIGQLFVNTSANIIYMATGTSSSSDWKALATWNP